MRVFIFFLVATSSFLQLEAQVGLQQRTVSEVQTDIERLERYITSREMEVGDMGVFLETARALIEAYANWEAECKTQEKLHKQNIEENNARISRVSNPGTLRKLNKRYEGQIELCELRRAQSRSLRGDLSSEIGGLELEIGAIVDDVRASRQEKLTAISELSAVKLQEQLDDQRARLAAQREVSNRYGL